MNYSWNKMTHNDFLFFHGIRFVCHVSESKIYDLVGGTMKVWSHTSDSDPSEVMCYQIHSG